MSRIKSFIRWIAAQARKVLGLLRIIDAQFFRTPRLVNRKPPSETQNVSRESAAEHIRNALSILHLTSVSVGEPPLVILDLRDWKAAWARLSSALATLEADVPTDVPPALTLDTPARPHIPRNVPMRERLRALDSARDDERRLLLVDRQRNPA